MSWRSARGTGAGEDPLRPNGALTLGGTRGGQRTQATTSPGAPNPDRELGAAHVRPTHRDEGQPGPGTGAQQAQPR